MYLPLAVLARLPGIPLPGDCLILPRDPLVEGVEGDFFAFLGVVGGGVDGSSLGDR
jgi:hypothetical protein